MLSKYTVWYHEMKPKRASLIKGRITCVNLQGHGMKGFFYKREIITSVFTLELSIGPFSWTVTHSFDEYKAFYGKVHRDPLLQNSIARLTVGFPEGVDGSDDVMVLIERKEALDSLMKEVLSFIDYQSYKPLYVFIIGDRSLERFINRIVSSQRLIRRFLAKKHFNTALFRFYATDLNRFIYSMEDGVAVYEASNPIDRNAPQWGVNEQLNTVLVDNSNNNSGSSSTSKHKNNSTEQVLWLDLSEEPALTRLCVAPKDIYYLPSEWEDRRLSNGLFISDIAEIRCGANSYGFTCAEFPVEKELCLSVVGSERTLDIQLVDESDFKRNHLIEMLRLLVLQSLPPNDIKLRNKKWVRLNSYWGEGSISIPQSVVNKQIRESEMLSKLLVNSIQVDEEVYSPEYGLHTVPRLLRYSEEENTLYISDDTSHDNADAAAFEEQTSGVNSTNIGSTVTSVRCMDIDDISEVRPGKLSSVIDGSEDVLMLTLIASETILCLPVPTLTMRNLLIRRFQSFIEVHRSCKTTRESSLRLQSRALAAAKTTLTTSTASPKHHPSKTSESNSSGNYPLVTSHGGSFSSSVIGGRSSIGMFEVPLGRSSFASTTASNMEDQYYTVNNNSNNNSSHNVLASIQSNNTSNSVKSSPRRPSVSSTGSSTPRVPTLFDMEEEAGNNSIDNSGLLSLKLPGAIHSPSFATSLPTTSLLNSYMEPNSSSNAASAAVPVLGDLNTPVSTKLVNSNNDTNAAETSVSPTRRKSMPAHTAYFRSNSTSGTPLISTPQSTPLRSISSIRSAITGATPRGSSMSIANNPNSILYRNSIEAMQNISSFRADTSIN